MDEEMSEEMRGHEMKELEFLVAISEEDFVTAEKLLKEGVDKNCVNWETDSGLMEAARKGNVNSVRFLLKQGCLVNEVNLFGMSALTEAAKAGHRDIVGLLLEAGATDLSSSKRTSALVGAVQGGSLEILKDLLGKIGAQEGKGGAALREAAEMGNTEMIEVLLKAGVNADEVEQEGETALMTALRNGHEEAVILLLKEGASLSIYEKEEKTPLTLAAANGFERIAELLLDHGVKVDDSDGKGNSALMIAAQHGHRSLVRMLIDRGADVEYVGADGQRPLHMGVMSRDLRTIEELLEAGASVSERDMALKTPVFYILSGWSEETELNVLNMLVEKGAGVNERDAWGVTLLMWAVAYGRQGMVMELLKMGADIKAVDGTGKGVMDHVVDRTDKELLGLLSAWEESKELRDGLPDKWVKKKQKKL